MFWGKSWYAPRFSIESIVICDWHGYVVYVVEVFVVFQNVSSGSSHGWSQTKGHKTVVVLFDFGHQQHLGLVTLPPGEVQSIVMSIVCLFVHLSVHSHNSKTARPNFTKFFVLVAWCCCCFLLSSFVSYMFHTHTHTQPFYGPFGFFLNCPSEPAPES